METLVRETEQRVCSVHDLFKQMEEMYNELPTIGEPVIIGGRVVYLQVRLQDSLCPSGMLTSKWYSLAILTECVLALYTRKPKWPSQDHRKVLSPLKSGRNQSSTSARFCSSGKIARSM